jgi:predicted enzyme related to lactoylglutathione lyase
MHGFGHIEIPTTSFAKSKTFFGKVFGWTFQDIPEMKYLLFRAGTPPSGGFTLVKSMPKKGQVNVYIEVEEIDSTLAAIRKARGKVLVKKTPVGTMGWMAQFATPDGCFLSLWQTAPRSPEAEEGTPVP